MHTYSICNSKTCKKSSILTVLKIWVLSEIQSAAAVNVVNVRWEQKNSP